MSKLFPRRYRKQPSPQTKDSKDEQSFFSRSKTKADQSTSGKSFFQAKLKVGQRGDKYEQEADAVADAFSRKANPKKSSNAADTPNVQKITLATPQEDEKLGTAEGRMEKDKLIQEKPNLQAVEEEEAIQQQAEEEEPVQMQEEEEAVQAMEEEEPVQMMEEEEAIQAMEEEEPVQMMEEEEAIQAMEEEEPVQMQEEDEAVQMSHEDESIEAKLTALKGKGVEISPKVRTELEASLGVDFSKVRIHTGPEAEALCAAIGAQAFTHGRDVFFAKGKYQPDSGQGQKLLAHELTHVVQQGHAPKKIAPTTDSSAGKE